MPFGESDCETSSTSARTAAVVVNIRVKTYPPCDEIPGPSTEINATSEMAVTAFTLQLLAGPVGVILVPGRSGANVLRIQTGIPDCIRGQSVLGCKTLAPKWARSAASR